MTELKIGERILIQLPDGFVKAPIPWLTAWVAALRSGNYKQGRGQLRVNDEYCCLGVLCTIQGGVAVPYNDAGKFRFDGNMTSLSVYNPCYEVLNGDGSFPRDVDVFLTISGTRRRCRALDELNDSYATFEEIAGVIEALWSQKEGP